MAKKTQIDRHLVALTSPGSFAAEQYQGLRLTIERLRRGRTLQIIAVTSPAAGEARQRHPETEAVQPVDSHGGHAQRRRAPDSALVAPRRGARGSAPALRLRGARHASPAAGVRLGAPG